MLTTKPIRKLALAVALPSAILGGINVAAAAASSSPDLTVDGHNTWSFDGHNTW